MTDTFDTDEFFSFVATTARKNYQEHHSHVPMFLIEFVEPQPVGPKNEAVKMAVVLANWQNHKDKDYVSYVIKEMCQSGKVNQVAFVNEVWMVEPKDGEQIDCAPSQHPNRFSALFLNLESKDGKIRAGYWPVKDADTDGATLQEFHEITNELRSATGRFANFFGERGTTQ